MDRFSGALVTCTFVTKQVRDRFHWLRAISFITKDRAANLCDTLVCIYDNKYHIVCMIEL